MSTSPDSKYLDEKKNAIQIRLSSEKNSIEWNIDNQRNKYRSELINTRTYTRQDRNVKLRYANHTIFSSFIAWPLSVLAGIICGVKANSFIAFLLFCAVFLYLWHAYDMAAIKRHNNKLSELIDELPQLQAKRFEDARRQAMNATDAIVAEYKEKVKAYAKKYYNSPISLAVAKWLASIMIPKINNANRADYFPHIKVQLLFTVAKDAVTTEGNQIYSLCDVGFMLDNSDYAPMGFAYAVSIHLNKLIMNNFPKDPSGTPVSVTRKNNDSVATITYDAMNGNFN